MLDVDQRPVAREALEPLDLPIDFTRVRGEVLAWAGVLLATLGLRLAALQSHALAPDDARHAFAAYELYTGRGTALDTAVGGPFATIFGALVYFLFGVTDGMARLGPALAGIALVLATIWLRPYLGRLGALCAGLLLAISPSVAFFSRRVQPDIYSQLFALILFVALLRALDHGRRGDVVLAAVAAALLVLTGPVGLTLLVLFAVFLALLFMRSRAEGDRTRHLTAADAAAQHFGFSNLAAATRAAGPLPWLAALVILVLGYTAFGVAPGNLLRGPADLLGSWGRSLFGPATPLPGRGPGFAWSLLGIYEPLALLAGLWALTYHLMRGRAVAEPPARAARALLGVWTVAGLILLALGGAQQPALVLLPAAPLTLLAGSLAGSLLETIEWRRGGWFWQGGGALLVLGAILALAAWGSVVGLAVQSAQRAGDNAWFLNFLLTLLALALPVTGAAWWLARGLGLPRAMWSLSLAGLLLLTAFGLRSAVGLSIYRFDRANEPLVYEASAPDILPLMDRLRRLARDVTGLNRTVADPTGGHGLSVAVDPAVEWPVRWYLRDFPDLRVGQPATLQGPQAPQLIFRPADDSAAPASSYTEQRYKLRWSYPAGEPLTLSTNNALLRVLGFLLFRDNVVPAPSTDFVVGYNSDLAARLFPQPVAQGPFGLSEHAGIGKAPGQFDSPRGIAVAPNGTIYVVDMRNARVQVFGRDGAFVKQFGSIGRGDGQFWRESGRGPTGIAVDPSDGSVYVADTWNHRVQKFTADGVFVAKWGSYSNFVTGPPTGDRGGFFGPRGIVVGANGEVYVTDTGNGRVLVFNRDGGFAREFGAKGSAPNQLNEPVGIAVSADGTRVYVADSNNARIAVFDPRGQPVAQWTVEAWRGKGFFEPYLALDPNGGLYATSSTTRQVLKLDRDGKVVSGSAGQPPDETLSAPIGVAVAPDRTVYLTDTTRNAVVRLQPLPDR